MTNLTSGGVSQLHRDLVEKCSFFEGLSATSVDQAIAHTLMRNHPANQVILLENDWGSSIHFIMEGWVKVRTHNLDGKEITLNVLSEGDLFGEMAALEATPRSTDVITLMPTRIASIPSADFIALLHVEPLAALRLAQILAHRLRQVNRRLRLREADSTARVVDVLLFLAEARGGNRAQIWEVPNLPHRELSSLSGLARETVTRVLSRLEKQGYLQREREVIRILNLENLEQLMG